ncbi:hypothetical protein SAMN06265337_0362 [Hymenobacter gelipurpurascens]|uniref:Uncharacterized protein n=1 Tax=Hymenobacter gelipurpurascens TaxID=89968 RepID=A0A212T5A1_9BACT|nr:hypothetical protein SAMN06265337_0362 [Hymenobacter gelipurpurascens]
MALYRILGRINTPKEEHESKDRRKVTDVLANQRTSLLPFHSSHFSSSFYATETDNCFC